MQQGALFYEDIYDAMRTVIQAAGGTKRVGGLMWADKAPQMAHTHLLNCLDRNRPEKMSPTQIVMLCKLGRQVGCHAVMTYLAVETGYSCSPIDPEDERAKLMREYIEAVRVSRSIADRLERLPEPQLKAVK